MTTYNFTVRATDAALRTADSAQSMLVAEDPYLANVVSLLHFDGTDASTTITDEAGRSWTAGGNAELDTAQSRFGTASLLLDGNGDFIDADGHANFALGSGDFTIEGWIRFNSMPAVAGIFCDFRGANVTSAPAPYCYLSATNIVYHINNSDKITAAHGVSTGSFVHVAICRASGTTRVFTDGIQRGSYVGSETMTVGASRPRLGARGGVNTGADFSIDGHIDEVRITKGVGRYTANFVPPAAPFPNP